MKRWSRILAGPLLGLAITMVSAAEDLGSLQSEEARVYLAPIEAYETLFTQCRIMYCEGGGGGQEAGMVRALVEAERVVDGPRGYLRSTHYNMRGDKEETVVAVTDGRTQHVLRQDKRTSTLTIEETKEDGVPCCTPFTRYLFQPSRGWGFANAKRLELLSEDSETVRLRFHREFVYMDADYAWHGDYLRITRFQSGSKGAQVSVAGTEYRYHYAVKTEGDRGLAPAKIEQISRMHGVHGVLEIQEVDLDPKIPVGQFELEIPADATVIDRTVEKSWLPQRRHLRPQRRASYS